MLPPFCVGRWKKRRGTTLKIHNKNGSILILPAHKKIPYIYISLLQVLNLNKTSSIAHSQLLIGSTVRGAAWREAGEWGRAAGGMGRAAAGGPDGPRAGSTRAGRSPPHLPRGPKLKPAGEGRSRGRQALYRKLGGGHSSLSITGGPGPLRLTRGEVACWLSY